MEGSRHRARSFSRKADAERFAAELTINTERGNFIDPKDGMQLFGPYANAWLRRREPLLERSTSVSYESLLRTVLVPTFGDTPLSVIDRRSVELWIAEKARSGLSGSRIRQAHVVLAQVLDDAAASRCVAGNAARGVRLPTLTTIRRHRYLTHDEL